MRSLIAVVAGVLVVTSTLPAQNTQPTAARAVAEPPKLFEVGKPVDDKLVFTDLDGKTMTLKDMKGKTVVLAWYCTTCPYMPPAIPKINQIQQDYKDKNVVLLGIASNTHDHADAKPAEGAKDAEGNPVKPFAGLRKHMAERKVGFKLCVDIGNQIADLFAAKTTPHMYVIDAKGVLRYSGALDNDPKAEKKDDERQDYVRQVIDAVLSGKEPAITSTKPYGCSIKRVAKADKPAA